MPPLSRSCERLVFIASMLLMTATRFHHVSDWLHLPDASMAVFFSVAWHCGGTATSLPCWGCRW